jgi:hypothetical protein
MGKRLFVLLVLLPAVASLSSCSIINSFVVVNRSGAPLEVQYKLKEAGATAGGPFKLDGPPAKKSHVDLEDYDVGWRGLGGGEFTFDEKAGVVTVAVQPGEALRVYETSNYSPDSKVDAEYFPIAGLRLSGARGAAEYDGEQARLQFKELTASIYTVTYY